ncbi:serine hydrolase [Nostoc sp.]|uniref:serine hydrolase n=1 Tax=Nostoc sp. TaxID=1180 RepID=UPI002FF91F84
MGQQSQRSSDKRDEQIAQLKAELERAYLIINQLQQENAQSHSQEAYFQNDDGHGYPLFDNGVSNSHSQKPPHRVRRHISKSSFNKLAQLQFVAIVAAVASGLAIVGVIVTSFKTKNVKEQIAKSSVSQTLNLPSHPPIVPTWAIAKSLPVPSRQLVRENSELAYNLQTNPNFIQSQYLQVIVNDLVNLTIAKGLPKKPLSITLINAKTGEIAGYHQDILRYPASVVKMFWLVALYAQIENGIWTNESDFNPYIAKMIYESDNEAASFIVDQITNTQSLPELKGEEFQKWQGQREQVNRFFQQAGYKDINISQKTFPLPYLKLPEPKGSDLQLRRDPNNYTKPIRNKITTEQAARLLYETCYMKQAVSPEASIKICGWLKRDINSEVWKKEPPDPDKFNPIRAFFGESLANTDVRLDSKAGWTSNSRQEAAVVATPDDQTIYILAIFADDPTYANDYKIFPKMSRLVYDRMTAHSFLK